MMNMQGAVTVLLLLFCSICNSKPVPQSTNPCEALKLPLCRVKSEFANKHGIKNTTPIKATRPKLKSALLPTTEPRPAVKDVEHSVKANDEKSLISVLRSKLRDSAKKGSNRDANDSCKGLRFCVLKKDVSPEKRRPDTGSTFVPTVRTPEEPVFVPEEPSDTFPSLLLLIRDNQLDEAKKYIEQGADVNEVDQHGNSLLLIAAQNGRDEIIEDLLLGGADVNFGNNHKNTAIHLAAQNGWTKVMEWLLKAKKININAKDLHANTALHLAAQNGAIGIVQMLLERPEIAINEKNTHAHVPLHLAAQNGHLELSRVLGSAEGINLNSKDLIGNTPLHTAYHTTHGDIASMLIQLGANPNARNLSGLRPQDLGKRR